MRSLIRVAAVTAAIVITLLAGERASTRLSAQSRARGTTISGRVTDRLLRANPDALVALLRHVDGQPADRLAPVDGMVATTSAIGRYSLTGVAPGDYYLVAIPTNMQFVADGWPNRSGFSVTYYPSAKTVALARKIHVVSRVPVIANVTLTQSPLAAISGRVVPTDDRPSGSVELDVAGTGPLFGLRGMRSMTQPDGRFGLAGFPPGTYLLRTREESSPGAAPDAPPRIFAARVAIDNGDVTNVRVVPVLMASVKARVTVSDPDLRPALTQSDVFVGAEAVNPEDVFGPERLGIIGDDLTCEFKAWPGMANIVVRPDAWMVKSVRARGVDVTRGIELKSGEQVELEVELTTR